MADGEIRQLYADREKTKPIYPRVSSNGVILKSGQSLEALETSVANSVTVSAAAKDTADSAAVLANSNAAKITSIENKEYVIVTLMAANWARAGNYLWYQNVSVSGMSEYWIPGPPEFYLGIYGAGSNIKWDEVKLQLEELPKINAVEAHDGYMTFICLEDYPTWDIFLYVPRIGGRAN